jgi:hypothetical protein
LQVRKNVVILPSNVEYRFCLDFRFPALQHSLHQECNPSFLCECLKKNSFVAGKVDLHLKQVRPFAITSCPSWRDTYPYAYTLQVLDSPCTA